MRHAVRALIQANGMNEPFIVDEEIDARRGHGGSLTGWETVVFEVEDEPPYEVFGDSESSTAAIAPWKPIFECVPSQNGFVVDPPQRQSAFLTIGIGLP
jgi:hypothetical protein